MAFLNRLRRNATSAAYRFLCREQRPRRERRSPPAGVTVSLSPGEAPRGTGRGTRTPTRGQRSRPRCRSATGVPTAAARSAPAAVACRGGVGSFLRVIWGSEPGGHSAGGGTARSLS